jgi:hypothetical protein
MRVLTPFVFALSSLSLIACGDDGGSGGPDAARIDAPGGPDGAAECTISTPNFGDKGALTANSFFAADPDMPSLYKISFTAPLEPAQPQDVLFFEIYTGYDPFGTQQAPTPAVAGTYQISGNQLQYADCSICLTLGSNGDGTTIEDDFMATGGTVVITEVGTAAGGNLNVTLTNLTFEQVTFNGATSTPVGNGCVTAISNATYTGTMMAPPANLVGPLPHPTKLR